MIYMQPLFNCLRFVIITKDQLSSADITDSVFLWCSIYKMVSCATSYACASSTHTLYNILVRNIYIDCIVHLLSLRFQCLIKRLSLWNCTWETVQYISLRTVILTHTVYNKIYDQFIRNKKSLIHVSFCFVSKLGTVFDVSTENISCGYMRNSILLSDHFCLCTFTCTGCA